MNGALYAFPQADQYRNTYYFMWKAYDGNKIDQKKLTNKKLMNKCNRHRRTVATMPSLAVAHDAVHMMDMSFWRCFTSICIRITDYSAKRWVLGIAAAKSAQNWCLGSLYLGRRIRWIFAGFLKPFAMSFAVNLHAFKLKFVVNLILIISCVDWYRNGGYSCSFNFFIVHPHNDHPHRIGYTQNFWNF